MIIQKTEGLIAAPFTPMRSDRSVNLDVIKSYANWLHSNGVVGAFICGTTGEGMSLTIDERQKIAERWMAVSPKGLRVIVHVGHASLADCRTLAAHAASIGADSTSYLAPFFFRPNGVAGLVDWCVQVACAAPQLPFYYHQIPSMTGVTLQVSEYLRLASKRIPNLAGVKYTFEDIEDCTRCIQLENGRFDILFGRDEMLLTSLGFGVRGAVGSTYNFAAPIYQALTVAYDRGDLPKAAELQALSVRMINVLVAGSPFPTATFKWFMSQVGIDCGPARLPLQYPTPVQIAALEANLETTGVYDWIKRAPAVLKPVARG